MHIAESAAWAAVLACRKGCAPAALDADELLRTLAGQGIMLAFFNDVNLASGEDWIPAVEYFSTRGFFPGYYARPADPLTRPVAAAWQKILREYNAPGFDPTHAAASVASAEQQQAEPAGPEYLAGLLNTTEPPGSITRAEACRRIFTQPSFHQNSKP